MIKEKTKDRARLDSIKTLITLGKRNARSELINYIEEYPGDKEGYYVYGKLALKNGEYELAKENFSIAAESESSMRYGALIGLGDVARKQGDNDLARKYFSIVIAESPREEEYAKFSLIRLERVAGNYQAALEYCAMYGESSTRLKIEKARVLCLAGKTEEADIFMSTITPENNFQRRDLSSVKALIATLKGNYELAKYYYSEVRDCGLKDNDYYKNLNNEARLLLTLGEYQAAYERALESYNAGQLERGGTNLILGKAKLGLKDYYTAYRHFQIAAETAEASRSDEYPTCKFYLGYLKYLAADYEAAEAELKESIRLGNKEETAFSCLLISYMRQKKFQEASQLIKAVRNDPKLRGIEDNLTLAEILIAKENGTPAPVSSKELYRYRTRQILNYSFPAAFQHISEGHIDKRGEACFPNDANIAEICSDVKFHLTPGNKVGGDFLDKYIIDYPNAGYMPDGEIADKICVITLPDTKSILTMFPYVLHTEHFQQEVASALSTGSGKQNSRVTGFQKRFANFVPPKV